jgi:hypothetical protein
MTKEDEMRGIIRCSPERLGLLAVLAAAILLVAGVTGASASTPPGSALQFWATPTTAGANNLVITGAIGDYGTSLNIDQNGKTNAKGSYAQITLQKGTFRINRTAFNTAANKASFPIDKASCSSEGSITAPATISNGTGLYKNISGKAHITLTLVWILSRDTNGKCDGAKVLFHSEYLTGTGAVSFS